MHKLAQAIVENVTIPLVHIADGAAERIQTAGLRSMGLLGTRFTMEEDFYKGRLTKQFGLDVIVPEELERKVIHDIIYDELCQGSLLTTRDISTFQSWIHLEFEVQKALFLAAPKPVY